MILLYLLVYYQPEVEASMAATHLLMTHVGPCDDSSGDILTLGELSIATQTYDSSLSGQFNISEDVENGWSVKATMQKCQDMRNMDTCDFFGSLVVVRAGCSEDDEAEEMYTMMFHYVKPDIECPIRAGVYRLENYPFFTEDNFLAVYESKISTSIFGYSFRLEGTTVDNRRFFCIEAYLQLLYMREHDWLASRHTHKHTRPTSSTTPKDDNDEYENE